jgi:hypothetical protein
MLQLGPKTPSSIAAVALSLKEEVLNHLWEAPKDNRDWDVELLTRFLDGLIALLTQAAKENEHRLEVA